LFVGVAEILTANAGTQMPQDGKCFAGFRANGVVEVYIRGADDAFAVDYIARGQGQFPGRVAIEFRQIHLEFDVDLRQVFRQAENDAEAARDFVVGVAENFEREIELLFCGRAMFGELGRES
jgi:hypothetical protein